MPDSREALLDRHLAGELSQREQRALAQTALDDPELFDLLPAVVAVKAVVLHGGPLDAFVVPRRPALTPRRRRRQRNGRGS
jgi:hypothetical protein